MKIEKKVYLEELFDLYSSLLTKHQQEIFSLYHFEDLSLHEIAENQKTSRNAVFVLLKRVYEMLESYEDKLSLHKKNNEIGNILKKRKITKKDKTKILSILER